MKRLGVVFFVLFHAVLVLGAAWAPYSTHEQNRRLSFAPPTVVYGDDGMGNRGAFVRQPARRPGDAATYHRLRWLERDPDDELRLFRTDAPSGAHFLGTDRYGRDMLSRVLHAGRLSLLSGIWASCMAVAAGLTIGALCVLFGGVVDRGLMGLVDLIQTLPWLCLLLAFRAFLPLRMDSERLFVLTIILVGSLALAYPARLARGAMWAAMQQDYVKVAIGFGVSKGYLFWRHLVPHARDRLLTHWALLIPRCVMAEVMLSFFGLGAEDASPSLGNLLMDLTEAGGAVTHPWMYSPVVVLGLAVLSYHLLAEALQSRLD